MAQTLINRCFGFTALLTLFLATAARGEFFNIVERVSRLPGNRVGGLIGRSSNPFPEYDPNQWQIVPHSPVNGANGFAGCGAQGQTACPELWFEPETFTSSGTMALVSTSAMVGASIKDGGQVCGHLYLSFFDDRNNLLGKKSIGSICRIATPTLRLGERETLTRTFAVPINEGASYSVRASVVCDYGNLNFQTGKFHCEAVSGPIHIVFIKDPASNVTLPTASSLPTFSSTTSTMPAQGNNGGSQNLLCEKTGCNGEVCAEKGTVVPTGCSTKILDTMQQCLRQFRCEVQPTGRCGWTVIDSDLNRCIQEHRTRFN